MYTLWVQSRESEFLRAKKEMKHYGRKKTSLRSYVRERIYSCGLFHCLPADTLLCPHAPHTVLITCDRPPAEFIPPVQEPYQYIIFRASEVKDLAVDEPPPRRSVHDDPAVLGVRVFISFPSRVLCYPICDESLRM
ncbi:hypothetical protein OG21DRAFT_1512030 [Imleria badia]|nr:hypothetical protein OG21DRAFT_1512030 [Imleria badia]